MKYNRIIMTEFGTVGMPDPCKSILERFASHFIPLNITDNNLINFFKIGKDLYTTSETSCPRRINPKDLTSGDQDKVRSFIEYYFSSISNESIKFKLTSNFNNLQLASESSINV